jgi:dimethylaniline monooxygenase (N-oxide forming)
MKVAVIGGGPAGLATLKFLVTAHHYFPIPPIEARLFEAEAEIGGTFVYRVYEDAEVRLPYTATCLLQFTDSVASSSRPST